MWLENNEGHGKEREACMAVRLWLVKQRDNAALEALARDTARKYDLPLKDTRRVLKRQNAAHAAIAKAGEVPAETSR